MGIMNNMKTVAAWTMNWFVSSDYFACAIFSDTRRYGIMSMWEYKRGGDVDMSCKIGYTNFNVFDSRFPKNSTGLQQFKQWLTDNHITITYETIDSVEEEIISYHPQQLLEEGILSNAGYTSSISFQNNVYTCKTAINTENNGAWRIQALTFQFKGGHKYLISALYRCDEKTLVAFSYSEGVASSIENPISYGSDYARASSICTYSNDRTGRVFFYFDRLGELDPANEHTVYVKNPIVVDLTELYGAGNEPTSVATFLSQHPEYNSYVPYYDGPINIEEEIIEKGPLKPVMADNEWTDIFDAFKSGSAPDTWQVGDTKPLTLLDGTTYTIRLCDKQAGRYQYSDGSGSSKAVFEFVELVKVGSQTGFQMNTASTNVGGWASCYMRGTIIPNFETFIPKKILAAISKVDVLSGTGDRTTSGTSSSANKLFLPAEMEMFSSKTYSIGNEECPLGQFDYYKTHDTVVDKVKKRPYSTSGYPYWLRSPSSSRSDEFCCVGNFGNIASGVAELDNGISPCFAI